MSEESRKEFDKWCPYSGSPDPSIVWESAWKVATRAASEKIKDLEQQLAEIKNRTSFFEFKKLHSEQAMRISELLAQVDRLREALQKIAYMELDAPSLELFYRSQLCKWFTLPPTHQPTQRRTKMGDNTAIKLWEYFVIYSGALGNESCETLASTKDVAEGNVREYFGQHGQIFSVTVRKIKRY